MLGESAIAVRTKAMKCLSEVVAVDPSILSRVKHPPTHPLDNQDNICKIPEKVKSQNPEVSQLESTGDESI